MDNKKELHLLLWSPFGAGTHYWGPGTSAYRLYKSNKDKNVKVTLVHGSKSQENFPDVYHEQIRLGNIDDKSIFSFLKYLYLSYIWIKKNHHKYDVVHGITAYFHMFIPALIFIKYKVPVFLKLTGEHGGFGYNSRVSKLTGFKRLREKNANKITGYISISSTITQNLINSGIDKDRIYYIPNGVDTERFYPVDETEKKAIRMELGIEDKFTCCYIGGLTRNKRVIETVKAIHELRNQGVDIQFLIVGPDRSGGIIEKEIDDYISMYQLHDVCIRVNHTDKPELYFRVSDLFILNSKSEGLSNSLLEAMSSGLPCVAYPASGTVDLIEDGVNGYLTDGQSEQITERIRTLYNNKEMCNLFSRKARSTIEKGFSVDYVINEHVKSFKKQMYAKKQSK